jgi:integrase
MAAVEASRFRDFFLLALYTGARTSNLIAMRWQDIDITEAVWVIPKTKNGDLQRVALSPEAIEILKQRKAHKVVNAVWVFPSHGKTGHIVSPRKAWADLFDWDELEQLKKSIMAIGWPVPESEGDIRSLASKHKINVDRLDHLRIHDLRRTLGSWQARQGASLTIIGKSLGHKSQQATQIYSRLDLDPVRQSVEQATASMRKASVANDE